MLYMQIIVLYRPCQAFFVSFLCQIAPISDHLKSAQVWTQCLFLNGRATRRRIIEHPEGHARKVSSTWNGVGTGQTAKLRILEDAVRLWGAPIGYLYEQDPEKLREVAHATCICTNGHPAADAACIGAAYLVKSALDAVPPEKVIQNLFVFTAGLSAEFD